MRAFSLRVVGICLVAIAGMAAESRGQCGLVLCPEDGIGVESAGCTPCGRPKTYGSGPSTVDSLVILKTAVGQSAGACLGMFFCICDVNGDGVLNTTDALLALKKAVGQPVRLGCSCAVPSCGPACTSAEISVRPGSGIDAGWTGIHHDSSIGSGAAFTVRIQRRCTSNGSECEHDDDCIGGTCEPACDCNNDTTCEVAGPTHPPKCRNDLSDCRTNADCDTGVPCVQLFDPPLPLSSGGTPICVVSSFDGPITGTVNSATGEAAFALSLRSRVFNGIAIDRPCPRCGAPEDAPGIGDSFLCEGGARNGEACHAEAVSPEFGGTSSECPPSLDSGISGTGLALRLSQLTTGTTSRTAHLPCKFFGFTGNPTVQGSNPKCLDTGTPCASNADCRRCTLDPSSDCTSNGDCGGKGTCAEAPDQPVTCGYWCNCGFCEGNASLPCMEDNDCPPGQECEVGTGTGTQPNAPQQRPNDCSNDKFICGGNVDEQCATTEKTSCSEDKQRTCETNADCQAYDAGWCTFEPMPCFESRITRTGEPSPLGTYCAFEDKACTTNIDCTEADDYCAPGSARPDLVALMCMPGTSKSGVNSAIGITGPAALRLNTFVKICRCGDGIVGCDEQCDDSNVERGDGCDDLCREEAVP